MGDKTYEVLSPVMGTFYRASAPDNPPLVEVGQKIKASDMLCVIESMKIFTELRSEYGGVVKDILVENEDPVMKKQALMIIEKE
jgi:biotin carboxyl carrier protein